MKRVLITLICLGVVVAFASQAATNLARPQMDQETLVRHKQKDREHTTPIKWQAKVGQADESRWPLVFFEDFEGVTPPAMPLGWKVVDGNGDFVTWESGYCSDLLGYNPPNYGTQYAWYSDDNAGSGAPPGYEYLIAPPVYRGGAPSTFYYSYGMQIYLGGEFGTSEYRYCIGSTWSDWIVLATYDADGVGVDTFPLAAADSVQVRFVYNDPTGQWGWAYGIDNVTIEEGPPHDVGCSEVVSPTEGYLEPGDYDIEGRIVNFGENAEDFTAYAEVWDTDLSVQVFSGSHFFDDFPVGGNTVWDFGSYNFEEGKAFHVKIYTDLVDSNPGNDLSEVYCFTRLQLGDIVFEMDAQTPTGDIRLVGVDFDGTYFYVSGSGDYYTTSYIHVLDTLGNLVCSALSPPWTLYGWGYMDLCNDADLMYSSAYSLQGATVDGFTVDPDAGTCTWQETFYGPFYANLALAYDPNEDVFFTGYWDYEVYKWNKSWTVLDYNYNWDYYSMIGAAYDGDYDAGGWVWWHSQDGPDPNYLLQIEQFDPETMEFTDTVFNYEPTITTGIAGGMDFYEGFRGMDVLFTLVQGDVVDAIVGLYVRKDVPVADATIDFDPNTLNLGSGGTYVKCFVELEEGFDVEDIDPYSVRIEKIDGESIDPVYCDGGFAVYGDYDSDGIPDVKLRFARADLIAAMEGIVIPPAYAELYVRGDLADADFGGTGMMRVINPQTKHDGAMGAEIPVAFALYEASPNPFSRNTVIRYAIPTDAQVKVNVYDVNGRLVKDLVNTTMQPGYYNIRWDGQDNSGRKLSSGVYFVKFETDDYRETQKLLLVR